MCVTRPFYVIDWWVRFRENPHPLFIIFRMIRNECAWKNHQTSLCSAWTLKCNLLKYLYSWTEFFLECFFQTNLLIKLKVLTLLNCTSFNLSWIFPDCPPVPVAGDDHNRSHDEMIMTTEHNITLPVTIPSPLISILGDKTR